MMVDGNISGEGGIAGCTPGGTAPPLRLSPRRPPGVTQRRGKNLHSEKTCCFGNGDPAGQGPWMAMWVVQAHREKRIGHCKWDNWGRAEPKSQLRMYKARPGQMGTSNS